MPRLEITHHINFNQQQMELLMSALTDLVTAAVTNLQSEIATPNPAAIAAAVHSVVDPEIATINTQITAILASQSTDEAKLADVSTAFTNFVSAFAPAAAPVTPLPTETPTAAAPVAGTVA